MLGEEVSGPEKLNIKPIARGLASVTAQFGEYSNNNTIMLSPFKNLDEETVG